MNLILISFQLPEGVTHLDMMHHMDHKMPKTLKVPILNTNKTFSSLGKNSPVTMLVQQGSVCKSKRSNGQKLLKNQIYSRNLSYCHRYLTQLTYNILEPDTPNVSKSIPDTDILEIARKRLKELSDIKYNSIVSKSAADIDRTNLIELDIPTEGPPVVSKPYTLPLKYREFVGHEIKQLEEAGIISRSMSDWASPILNHLKEKGASRELQQLKHCHKY